MRRALVFLAIAGCNGLLGIESADFVAPTHDAGEPNPRAPDGAVEASSTTDSGFVCTDTTADPHNCGRCGHDCGGGPCAAGVCEPYVVLSEPGVSYVSVAIDATNAYFTDKNATIRRVPLDKSAAPTTMFTGSTSVGLAPDLAVHDGFLYFIDDLTGDDNAGSVVRCPVTGCVNGTPEPLMTQLTAPNSLAVDSTGAVIVGTGGPSGTILRCATPPCGTSSDTVVPGAPFITQVGVSGTIVAWAQLGPVGEGNSSLQTYNGSQTHIVQVATGIFDLTMTSDQVFFGSPNNKIEAAPFDSTPTAVGNSPIATNLANDGSFVYWTDSTIGTVWRISVAAGSAPTKVSGNQNSPTYVTVDSQSVVWLSNPSTGGTQASIVRLVK